MPSPTLVKALEAELEQTRKQIDELGSYADSLRSIIAKGESTNGPARTRSRAKRNRRPSDRKLKTLAPEKLEAFQEYLRRNIGAGGVFAIPDLNGWQGFQELGLSKSSLSVALRQLSDGGQVQIVDRKEHPEPGRLGPRAKVYRLAPQPAAAPS